MARLTVVEESVTDLSEITLKVLGDAEAECMFEERVARYIQQRIDAIRLRRAEAHTNVEEARRQLRMAEGACSRIDEDCDAEEKVLHQLEAHVKHRRVEIVEEKNEAAKAASRAGFRYLHPELTREKV